MGQHLAYQGLQLPIIYIYIEGITFDLSKPHPIKTYSFLKGYTLWSSYEYRINNEAILSRRLGDF